MNAPPTSFVRVTVSDLHSLITGILGQLGVPAQDAGIIGDLMVDTDLRGVSSHGSQPLAGYSRGYQNG